MPKKKYTTEQNEAEYVLARGGLTLPYKIKTKEPRKLAHALGAFFRRRKLSAGVSTDPDGNAVYVRQV